MKYLFIVIALVIAPFSLAKNLVFVHSYHFGYPWVQEYREGFMSEIDGMTIHDFQMDTKRRPSEDFEAIADEAWEYIQQHNPDIVVISDDNALKYLGPRLTKSRIPTVFLGVNANPRQYVTITANISGVLERPLLKRSVHMISELQPDVKKIKVMMDAAATSHAILMTSFGTKRSQIINGVAVDAYLVDSIESWHEHTKASKNEGYDALIIANYAALKDEQGNHFALEDVSRWTSSHTPVPLYAFWTYSVGEGKAIGGLAISALEQGIAAAQQVKRYMESGIMPVIVTPKKGALVFSQSELDRWDIQVPESLMKNAELRN
ncbi:ABC transporter substrate-binding protein [Vibrio makurazakiensis]|uniref:ABC transporter substrate-binding protein n=1 Tax=Vibrio makurazakiensis TaxID=2910250 RepID=UPI003D0C095E